MFQPEPVLRRPHQPEPAATQVLSKLRYIHTYIHTYTEGRHALLYPVPASAVLVDFFLRPPLRALPVDKAALLIESPLRITRAESPLELPVPPEVLARFSGG
jgi:hypothetical protein